MRTVAGVLDDLGTQALPRLLRLATALDLTDLVPAATAGSTWRRCRPTRPTWSRSTRWSATCWRGCARSARLACPAGSPRRSVSSPPALRRLSGLTATAARAATLLPPMLGGPGPRTYLVLFQNLTEVRATGGMPGAFIVVRADRGAITIVDQGSAAAELGTFAEPVLPLDPALRALYTDRLGMFPADVNVTPHFPTAAVLAREMYRRRSGPLWTECWPPTRSRCRTCCAATGPLPVPADRRSPPTTRYPCCWPTRTPG